MFLLHQLYVIINFNNNTSKMERISLNFADNKQEEILHPFCSELVKNIKKNFGKANILFSWKLLNLEKLTLFEQSVLKATYKIPFGSVISYKKLASWVGLPNGARAVANALAKNPFPLIIPCHRVIKSNGNIGGYAGSKTDNAIKKHLLEKEGAFIKQLRIEVGLFKKNPPSPP